MVGLVRAYSKRPDLLEHLDRTARPLAQAGLKPTKRRSVSSTGRVDRIWRTSDKLTADDEGEIVRLFMIGTAKTALARKYAISESSVKRLLRKHGARRTSWADRRIPDVAVHKWA
jgi:DNA invertase Pin-like site-specific DNA recombinase